MVLYVLIKAWRSWDVLSVPLPPFCTLLSQGLALSCHLCCLLGPRILPLLAWTTPHHVPCPLSGTCMLLCDRNRPDGNSSVSLPTEKEHRGVVGTGGFDIDVLPKPRQDSCLRQLLPASRHPWFFSPSASGTQSCCLCVYRVAVGVKVSSYSSWLSFLHTLLIPAVPPAAEEELVGAAESVVAGLKPTLLLGHSEDRTTHPACRKWQGPDTLVQTTIGLRLECRGVQTFG